MRRPHTALVLSLAVLANVADGFSTASFFGTAMPKMHLGHSASSLLLSPSRRPSYLATPRASKSIVSMAASTDVDALVQKVRDAAGKPAPKAPNRIFKALRKPTGAPTVAVEFMRGEGLPHTKVDEMSLTMRREKAALIVVDVSVDQDGEKDLQSFVKEQSSAKTEFPGSVSIVWRGGIDSVEAVAKAAAAGCQGVAVSVTGAGDKMAEIIHACHTLGMEAVVEVRRRGREEGGGGGRGGGGAH
jgi:hypothetical protein